MPHVGAVRGGRLDWAQISLPRWRSDCPSPCSARCPRGWPARTSTSAAAASGPSWRCWRSPVAGRCRPRPCSTRCGRASRRRRAPPACSPTSPTCVARSSRTGPPGPRAGCSSPAVTATRWPRAPSTSTPGASSGWSSRPARRRTRVGASSCSRSRWRCGAARSSVSTPAPTGPTPRRAVSSSSGRSRASGCWRPASTPARAPLVVPELEALLAEDPLREERWRLLALAQYRAHRQADALATLRRARETLAEELGVDPGPALRTLEAAGAGPVAAARRSATAAAARPACPPQRSRSARSQPRELVDRERRVRPAAAPGCATTLSGEPGLAVIAGPAGIGKTRLLDRGRGHGPVRRRAPCSAPAAASWSGSTASAWSGSCSTRCSPTPRAAQELLTGAAAAAARVFDSTVRARRRRRRAVHAAARSLLADRQPRRPTARW